jgi:2,3-bisphosphoglycerate-independent phosphoglycerate mutase
VRPQFCTGRQHDASGTVRVLGAQCIRKLACTSYTVHKSFDRAFAACRYDPRSAYRGRGAFEALGAGCTMDAGDIAFKSNLATIDDESGVVTHRRVDRDFDEEGPVLCAHIDGALVWLYMQLLTKYSEATGSQLFIHHVH